MEGYNGTVFAYGQVCPLTPPAHLSCGAPPNVPPCCGCVYVCHTSRVSAQTASGKTYTLFGEQRDPGVTMLAVDDVFRIIRERVG